jgi:putative ABC transport system permease protein
MILAQLQSSLEMGLLYSLVTMGIYLSFRVLHFPDLTVDGTFPLGAAICAALITAGVDPYLATALAMAAGAFMGWMTAFLSGYLRILNLLAGILTMSALYSINLRVMGNRPNLSLLGEKTVLSQLTHWIPIGEYKNVILLGFIVALLGVILIRVLNSEFGLAIRVAGNNARMARSHGVDDRKMIRIGLSISNAYVALSGALFAQLYGFADVSLGVGTIIIGLASLIIGETILPIRSVSYSILACVVGTLVYRVLIAFALNLDDVGLQASDLNLITSILVAFAMSLHRIKDWINQIRLTKESV